MTTTQSSTTEISNTKARMVTGGSLDGDTFVLTFDDGLKAITKDEAIATAASNSKRQGVPIVIDLEARPDGPPVIVELKPAPKQELARPETAVAKPTPRAMATAPALPTGVIVDPRELTQQLDALSRDFNVISPMIGVSQFAPGYGVNLVVVRIDPTITDEKNGRGVDTYRKPFTKYTITFDSGEAATTFSSSLYEIAIKAKKSGQWVKAQLEENEQYPDQQNLKALEILDGTQPDLPIAGEEKL